MKMQKMSMEIIDILSEKKHNTFYLPILLENERKRYIIILGSQKLGYQVCNLLS